MQLDRTRLSLVCVQSSWYVGEADLARVVLAAWGIPCHVENETINTFCWTFANITGGFKVLVPERDAVEAARVLQGNAGDSQSDGASPWQCRECGWRVDSDWDICWFCQTPRQGGAPVAPAQTESGTPRIDESEIERCQRSAGAVLLILLMGFWASGGSLAAAILMSSFALMVVKLREESRRPSVEPPDMGLLEAERLAMSASPTREQLALARSEAMSNHLAKKALLAALFSVTKIPPLAILSAALLRRLKRRETPCSPLYRRWVVLAHLFTAVGLMFTLVLMYALTVLIAERAGIPAEALTEWSLGNSSGHS